MATNRVWGLLLVGLLATSVAVGAPMLDGPSTEKSERTSVRVAEVGERSSERAGVLNISATVTNPKDSAQTRTVLLKIDRNGDGEFESTVERRRMRFESGERRRLSFRQTTDRLQNGSYRYGVFLEGQNATATENATVTVDVRQPPEFRLSEVPDSVQVVRDETTAVSLDVTNVGNARSSRPVRLFVDADGDGEFGSDERAGVTVLELDPDQSRRVSVDLRSTNLEPGTYDFRIESETDSKRGNVTVLRPATFDVRVVDAPANVTRGDPVNLSVRVSNTGDVEGTETVRVGEQDGGAEATETVTLESDTSTTLNVTLDTANSSAGDVNYTASTAAANDSVTVHVDAPRFEVSRLRSSRSWTGGKVKWIEVRARVTNAGDAAGSETVSLRIDLDGDDDPERLGFNRSVSLGVGERETVEFRVLTEFTRGDAIEKLPVGTYIYGVFAEQSERTNVVSVEDQSGGGSSAETGDGDSDVTQYASLDEIAQSKYGVDYEELSGETRRQIEEIHTRQPFVEGLAVTEVLTREEFAREKYDVDLESRHFEFGELDVELQQRIEADFDAQFTSDDGDRVESWDELAQKLYGTDFESLTDAQKEAVRDRYRRQFE